MLAPANGFYSKKNDFNQVRKLTCWRRKIEITAKIIEKGLGYTETNHTSNIFSD